MGSGYFEISEKAHFTSLGVMIDVSQRNGVLRVENIKKLINKLAVMGMNMLMLYTEDSFEVKDEPYFGYMRGKYSFEELKECDDYAEIFGIEMIPCIQTLAHLTEVLKWDCYEPIKEDEDTLLVGHEKTYEFVERMIAAASKPFRSKRIHIGMDEAEKLGQGKFLIENGYCKKFDIMSMHLDRVLQITRKYELKPMIWSDMYFKAGSSKWDYYDRKCIIPADVKEKIPKDIQFVYWDYYHDEEFFTEWLRRHKELCAYPVFAGAAWSWKSFGVNYGKTFATTDDALRACKKEGIKEVFITVWGTSAAESNFYTSMLGLQLYAEHGYSDELDVQKLEKRFKFCTGANYYDYMDIRHMDETPGTKLGNLEGLNPSKYLLWQDILMGLFDKNINGLELNKHYEELGKRMERYAASNGEMGFVFTLLEKVCSLLSIKSEIGLKLTEAYKNKNLQELGNMSMIHLPELYRRVVDLRIYHRQIWQSSYKNPGWEIFDLRYGFLLMRIDTAVSRINDYLGGNVGSIEELEMERLYFSGIPGLLDSYSFERIVMSVVKNNR